VDRIILNGYFRMAYTSSGFLSRSTSTHRHRSRMSAACGGGEFPATAAARLVSSFGMGLTLPLSYVPWLHGRCPASSLLWALWLPPGGSSGLAAMNTVWSTAGLPAYLVHTSNPSVPGA
jgi:hypothetical protein